MAPHRTSAQQHFPHGSPARGCSPQRRTPLGSPPLMASEAGLRGPGHRGRCPGGGDRARGRWSPPCRTACPRGRASTTSPPPHWQRTWRRLTEVPNLRGIAPAKTEHPDHITKTAMYEPARGTPAVAPSTRRGLTNAYDIARAPGVFRPGLRRGDFRSRPRPRASDGPRVRALHPVTASRVGELPGPIRRANNGVSGDQLEAACKVTQSMGMTSRAWNLAQTDS
ncbi:hypothetical protein QJS66_17675 [Kocuria rhizophila]|nr:hypothetical protein QJS66_17675 [Kocuria rhizophila]